MRGMKHFLLILCSVLLCALAQAQLPKECTQVVVGITEGWNSSYA